MSDSDDQRATSTALDGIVPGALLGAGGGLLGVVIEAPTGVATFVGGVGVLVFVLGGLAHLTADSVAGASLGEYAGDREFGTEDARRTGLRLAGLGAGLVLGAVAVWGALG